MKIAIFTSIAAIILVSSASVFAAGGKCIALGRVGGEDVACAAHKDEATCNDKSHREWCSWQTPAAIYKSKKADHTNVLQINESGTEIFVLLAVGYTNEAGRCEEGETRCAIYAGPVSRVATNTLLFSDEEQDCAFVIEQRKKSVVIKDLKGDCGLGTANRGLINEIVGKYK